MSNLIAAGQYDAMVATVRSESGADAKVQFGVSKAGTKQCLVHFELLSGPDAGQRLPWWGAFTKDAGKRTIESLRFAGFRGDDLMQINGQALDQRVSVTVEHHEWEGKVHARVAWVNKPGGGQAKFATPMSMDDLRAFSAQCRASIKGIPEVAGEKADRKPPDPFKSAANQDAGGRAFDDTAGGGREPGADANDDNIPF